MIQVLVSACLLGQKVRYNGADSASSHSVLATWCAEGRVVPFCPEVAGVSACRARRPRSGARVEPRYSRVAAAS
jgi:uncharacterized protein YbbK (DUF523 family)